MAKKLIKVEASEYPDLMLGCPIVLKVQVNPAITDEKCTYKNVVELMKLLGKTCHLQVQFPNGLIVQGKNAFCKAVNTGLGTARFMIDEPIEIKHA